MAVDDGFTDEQRNKLELLTEAFTTDEIKALANYDVEHVVEQTGMSRRQVLGIGAMLAGGAATGGYAVSELVDPAQAQADTGDSDGNVGLPTDRVDVFADGVDANSLSTEEGTITNETFIRADRTTETASTASGTYINLYDAEGEDSRSEFNSSQQFVPDKTGTYIINGVADFRGSTTADDDLRVKVFNVTDGTNATTTVRSPSVGANHQLTFTLTPELEAGKKYEVRGSNFDSSFTLHDRNTSGLIRRSVVQ